MTTEIKYQYADLPLDGLIVGACVPELLRSGGMLLTASAPLTGDWKRRLMQTTPGEEGSPSSVMPTPNVVNWSDWLRMLILQSSISPLPLTPLQEINLWQQILERDTASRDMDNRSLAGLARHAAKAYALIRSYRVDVAKLAAGNEESEALHRWMIAIAKEFDRGQLTGRCLAADVATTLVEHMSSLQLPTAILLDAREFFTPQQLQLFEVVRQAGCPVHWISTEAPAGEIHLTACRDQTAEFAHAAAQVKRWLDATPGCRIGIFCADMQGQKSILGRYLDAALPSVDGGPSVRMPGEPLSRAPMVRQLLHVLGLIGRGSLDFSDFSPLLFMPWLLGFEQERLLRAGLDVRLRRMNRHHLSLSGMHASRLCADMPSLRHVFAALDGWSQKSRSPLVWVQDMQGLLQAIGFVQIRAGDEGSPRDDHEIQQMNAFRDVLAGLVGLQAVRSSLSWKEFVSQLQAACTSHLISGPCRYPNVVVLGIEQAIGLSFDHVLVLGLDEDALPSAPKSHPLLPMALQKQYGMPLCDGQRAFQQATHIMESLRHAGPEVLISYAAQKQDREVTVSPLLAALPCLPFDEEDTSDSDCRIADQLVCYEDAPAVPLAAHEEIRGGTAIIRNQSACPFRSFAKHRLKIEALEETSPGIDPASKGSLIHLALEYIWSRLQSQAALAALAEADRLTLIEAAIEHAWQQKIVPVDVKTRGYEQQRMRSILLEWLQLELQRPAFKVMGIEQSFALQLPQRAGDQSDLRADAGGQFTVHIKADRIDADDDGRNIVLDYKTGAKQSTAKWLGERMEEPQLPLYAVAAELGPDDAVAYARVRSGDMAYEGLCGEPIGIAGIIPSDGKRNAPDDWQQVLDDWKTQINALAAEVVEGRCEVMPRNAYACNYCGLEAVCRIAETGFDSDADEVQEGEQP